MPPGPALGDGGKDGGHYGNLDGAGRPDTLVLADAIRSPGLDVLGKQADRTGKSRDGVANAVRRRTRTWLTGPSGRGENKQRREKLTATETIHDG